MTSEDPTRSVLTRRRVLAGAATAVAIGAGAGIGGTELSTHLSGGAGATSAGESLAPPDVDLMQEHGVLKRVLLIYQTSLSGLQAGSGPLESRFVSAIHNGALIIHDFIEAFHEALEEGYVFPALRDAGQLVSTVDTLLLQHARGRERTQVILANATQTAMADPVIRNQVSDAVDSFVRMYQPHEAREDTVVFPAFRALLGARRLEELAATFGHLQQEQLGSNAFADAVNQVAAIEQSLGIYELTQFTPPAVVP